MLTGPSATFVGRTAELALLETAFRAAVAGSPRTVFIGGEAGVGKTRLVTEFSTRAQAGARVLTGHGFELSTGGLPYGPAIEMLRQLARSLDPAGRRELLEPAEAELGRLLPAGDAPHGWPSDASAGSVRTQFLELVLRIIGRIGRRWPLVLIVEDMHWADPSTLDLLTFVVHNLRRERVLIVGTYRSEELFHRRQLRTALIELERSPGTRSIELASFGREELTAQLSAVLGSAPPAPVVERIYSRSEGNAFFAEELLAAGMGTADVQLPRRLRDIILGRFETLSEDAQDVLRVVAAAGWQVSHQVIATATDLSQRALLQALREAVGQQFLVGGTDRTYSFRHELAREAVYGGLLAGERPLLHATIARALVEESRHAGDQATMLATELAYHWRAADEPAKALAASVEAGRLAIMVHAFADARPQLEQALELWDRVPEAARPHGLSHGRLLQQAADSALWAGDVERALFLIREAIAGSDPSHEPDEAGVFHERLGHYLWRSGDNDESLAALAEADRLFANQAASRERARVLAGYARLLTIAGRYSEARNVAERAVAMARTIGARREEGHAQNILGLAMTMLGSPDIGIVALVEARSIAEEAQNLEDLVRAYNNLAFALENAGRLDEAADEMLAGLAVARGVDLDLAAALLVNATIQLFQLGRWPEVEELLGRAERLEASARWGPYLAMMRGELAVALGRLDDAEAHLEAARRTSGRLSEPQFLGPLHACLAELAIARGDPRAAGVAVREGLRLLAGSEDIQLAVRLCAVGIRAAADAAELAAESPATADVERARSAGAALLGEARRLVREGASRGTVLPEAAAMLELCEAELARLEERAEPARWLAVARSWDDLHQPYRAMYARARQAEALLLRDEQADAAAVVRQAHAVALRLGAEPLRRRLELLVEQSGVELWRPAEARG